MPTAADVIVRRSLGSHAAHTSVPVSAVRLTGGHLADRMRINRTVSIPSQYEQMEATGRLWNFERAAGTVDGDFRGIYYNDSDVYKWLEGACWALAAGPDAALQGQIDHVVRLIRDAARPDGYVNTWFARERADERWTDLPQRHELYCAGHLIQAAIAHHRVTGERTLLDVAIAFADHIGATFNDAGLRATDGHEEIEMALIELARETGNAAYREHAAWFLRLRGEGTAGGDRSRQDDIPLRDRRTMEGHAVRAVYLNAGAADLTADTPDDELRTALTAMEADMLLRKSSVMGGIGARFDGEAFGAPYELPNSRAYNESCAAIGAAMWMWRMQLLVADDDSHYGDVIERLLYNAVLPGVGLDGRSYFYENPLRDGGTTRRQPYFDCACCPPNLARFIAQLPGYIATTSTRRFPESDARHDVVWIHQFATADLAIPLQDGTLALHMDTEYPWDGTITLDVTESSHVGDVTLNIRVPEWASGASATVNGTPAPAAEVAAGQYLTVRRVWQAGDRVVLHLPMPVRRIVAHPRVSSDVGRVALMRGPLVYCLEEADNSVGDLRDVVLDDDVQITAARQRTLLGDCVVLSAHAHLTPVADGWNGALYRRLADVKQDTHTSSEAHIRAVPYMLWANRSPGPMAVWVRRDVLTGNAEAGSAFPRES